MNGDTTRDASSTTSGAPPASHAALPKGTRLQEFEVVQVVGEGGFGIVYLADDTLLHRAVAVKEYMPASLASRGEGHSVVVRSEQNLNTFQTGMRSFISEARMLAQFKHPALVEVFRFWEQNGTAYMAMPYYQGRTLRQVLQGEGLAVDERWLKSLFAPLMDALELMHAQSIYHRDVAPDNILILGNGAPVLLDLGAARRIIGDLTQAVTVVLKPGYAPVEQYADDGSAAQGPWTDIYALGAVIYFAITGRAPVASVSRIMKDTLKPLDSATYPNYSDAFLEGVGKALAVKPEDRPRSIAELRELLGITSYAATTLMPPTQPLSTARRATVVTAAPTTRQSVHAEALSGTPASAQPAASASAPPTLGRDEAARALDQLLGAEPDKAIPASAGPGPTLAETTRAEVKVAAAKPTDSPAGSRSEASARPVKPAAAATPAGSKPGKLPWLLGIGGVVLVAVAGLLFMGGDKPEAVPANPPSTAVLNGTPGTPQAIAPSAPAAPAAPVPEAAAPTSPRLPPPAVGVDTAPSPRPASEAAGPPVSNSPGAAQTAGDSASLPQTGEAPLAEGRVRFSLAPWGDIWVDGVKRGPSPPLKSLKLPVGTHRIELRNPGFQTEVRKIRVNKGETVVVEHHFTGEPGQGFNSY